MTTNLMIAMAVQISCRQLCGMNPSFDNATSWEIINNQTIMRCGCGLTYFSDIGVLYKYHNDSLSWNSAKETCKTDGSNLAVIDSFKKINYIHGLKDNDHNSRVFLGIHRSSESDEWVNVKTGLPVSSIPWAPNQSTNSTGSNCLAAYEDGSGVGAVSCDNLYNFVCEISYK